MYAITNYLPHWNTVLRTLQEKRYKTKEYAFFIIKRLFSTKLGLQMNNNRCHLNHVFKNDALIISSYTLQISTYSYLPRCCYAYI